MLLHLLRHHWGSDPLISDALSAVQAACFPAPSASSGGGWGQKQEERKNRVNINFICWCYEGSVRKGSSHGPSFCHLSASYHRVDAPLESNAVGPLLNKKAASQTPLTLVHTGPTSYWERCS